MILYLDSSSLVKRYVREVGADEVMQAVDLATQVATVTITRVEIAAALAKAVRQRALTRQAAWKTLQLFREDWTDLVRLTVTDLLVSHADALAWEHGLRGYDAVQLAAASLWQEMMDEPVTFSTFDQRLWTTAQHLGLLAHPQNIPELLTTGGGRA